MGIKLGANKGALQRIVKIYAFVSKHKLLDIFGIYHDSQNERILIVMQRLSHELSPKYFIDSAESINLRFARPGYIYVNSEDSIKSFIEQIAKQLNKIHSKNRVHFDLKPSNLMFNAIKNEWTIIDFDLMKKTKKQKNENKVRQIEVGHYRGTQSWTSPEMSTRSNAQKPSIITSKSDIFSFGLLILYVIDCGYQPYLLQPEDIQSVHCKELTDSPKWRRDKVYFDKVLRNGNGEKFLQNYLFELKANYLISSGLYNLLKNMLAFDVEKRFNCAQILNHWWLNSKS